MTTEQPTPVRTPGFPIPVRLDAFVDRDRYKEFRRDLLIIAVEGGVNYWANIVEYRHSGPQPYAVLLDVAEDGEPRQHRLDLVDIHQAILAIVRGDEIKHFPASLRRRLAFQLLDGEPDAGEFDASDADCIAQVATLGEVVYG